MRKLQCQRCHHVWEYRGKKTDYYTNCPRCAVKVHVRKRVVSPLVQVG